MSDDKCNFDFEYVLKIQKQLKETEEEIAYAMISPFCERIVEKKLSKKELEKILRKGMQPSIPLDRIKEAREEMESKLCKGTPETTGFTWQNLGINICLEILDKLIEGEECYGKYRS